MSFQALNNFTKKQKLARGVSIKITRDRLEQHLEEIAHDNESPFNIDHREDREVHLFTSIRTWAHRRMKGEFEFTWPGPDLLIGRFEKRKDAMLFKLTWG